MYPFPSCQVAIWAHLNIAAKNSRVISNRPRILSIYLLYGAQSSHDDTSEDSDVRRLTRAESIAKAIIVEEGTDRISAKTQVWTQNSTARHVNFNLLFCDTLQIHHILL